MAFKKQDFNGQQLAMFFQAFGKNLFIRPVQDDLYSMPHLQDDGCTLYFKNEYYERLKNSIKNKYKQGEFARSNANELWVILMNEFLTARTVENIDKTTLHDYFDELGQYWM